MKGYAFAIEIEPDQIDDGSPAFRAWCPDLKGCHSWGATKDEAIANIREAIELYVSDMIADGEHASNIA